MRELLLKTADRLDKKPGRPRFPKSESFGMIADLRGAARNIVRGVHAANETIFIENPEERLKEIKAVIDECNLMLRLVALSNDLGYADIKRVETWTGTPGFPSLFRRCLQLAAHRRSASTPYVYPSSTRRSWKGYSPL